MVEKGAFNDVDIAMMVHPGTHDVAANQALACQTLDVEFFGRAAHAAAYPEKGINALDAILQAFNAINALRQHMRDKARIHGIITEGGEAANVVPAHSAGNFIVRAEEDSYLDELKEKVLNCFIGAATATGTRLEYHWGDTRYAPLLNNPTLVELFTQNMESLGRSVLTVKPSFAFGSTDMGNVSQIVPAIHPTVAIAPEGIVIHSPQFAEAAASDAGKQGLLDAAKALALTALDLLARPEMVTRAKEEFARQK